MKKTIDTSQAHTGRVYDYILGGTQNFEADRQAAEAVIKVAPSVRTQAQLNRWFLQFVANRWAEEGHTQILDLASGLPTQGHLNDHLPNARILFSDHDPLSVQYGQEILQDAPNMRYVLADLRDPTELLGIADALVELKAVCECGRKATMNLRVDERGRAVVAGAQTEIGGNDRYVAMCRRHFMEKRREASAALTHA